MSSASSSSAAGDATTPSSTSSSSSAASHSLASSDGRHRRFLCGVVEGFYGRPWTTEQRKDLFNKMQAWGMNSYLYAPKDDCKHRAYWRELYTVEEAEHLQSLISLAQECDIDFYYAISPGLDITYSNGKEVACLKRKLDQVAQLGCKCFSLLFDDIEPEMCKQDKEAFQSFGHAQVALTNEIYQHLCQPKFLFCPTQYCRNRAVPTVRNSEYLTTIGSKLAPEIQIMWTGDKVISKTITMASLEDVNDVLQRPVVIWDNEHANDYDQKRVYLGPYSGRSPELVAKLGGVMTNPNCEFGANFVGVHTLAQWSKCVVDGTEPYSGAGDAVSADIKLEMACSTDCVDHLNPPPLAPGVYHPRNALANAIREWVVEFSRQKTVWGPMSKPQVGLTAPTLLPSVATCMSTTTTTALVNSLAQPLCPSTLQPVANGPTPPQSEMSTPSVSTPTSDTPPIVPLVLPTLAMPVTTASSTSSFASASACNTTTTTSVLTSIMQPISLPVMNSLVSTNKVVVDHALLSTATEKQVSGSAMLPLTMEASVTDGEDANMVPLPATVAAAVAAASNSAAAVAASIIPGPTYLEPMDEDAVEVAAAALAPSPNGNKTAMAVTPTPPAAHADIYMESLTNPPTPASLGMQVDHQLHKSESTQMLCDTSDAHSTSSLGQLSASAPVAPPAASSSAASSSTATSAAGGGLANGSMDLALTDAAAAAAVSHNTDLTSMLCDEVCTDARALVGISSDITAKDLLLLCHLFYLPCDHGQVGLDLLNDFYWLKRNATVMLPQGTVGSGSLEERQEWERRASRFKQTVLDIQTLFVKLCTCQNRELVYDIYTYLWDMCMCVQTLDGFVQWLAKGSVSPKSQHYVIGQQTWFSGMREAFLSGDYEPWVFRGGLVSDLQRLLPLDSGTDLYAYKFPEVPASLLYYVRPYQPKDEAAICAMAADAYEELIDAPMGLCASDRVLVGDKTVGAFLTLCPDYTFVCESSVDGSLVAFAVAAPDAKAFYTKHAVAWLPEMRSKYPMPVLPRSSKDDESEMLTPLEQMAASFHSEQAEPRLPDCCLSAPSSSSSSVACGVGDAGKQPAPAAGPVATAAASTWAVARLRVSSGLTEASVAKRLTMLLLASLRASGTFRVFVEVPAADVRQRDLLLGIGFAQMNSPGAESVVYFSRSF